MEKTVRWYQTNTKWVNRARSGEYIKYYERMYATDLQQKGKEKK